MTAKASIPAVLAFGVLLLSGCNIASGENSKVVQTVGNGSKSAGQQQDVPSDAATLRLQEETRLANDRAKLAEERAEFEKQKREFAEEQLKRQEESKTEPRSSSEVSQAEPNESSAIPPAVSQPRRRNRSYRPRHTAPEHVEDEAGGESCVCPADEGDEGEEDEEPAGNTTT